MSWSNKVIISILFASTLVLPRFLKQVLRTKLNFHHGRVGWETNMDGVYELELSGDDDIIDSIEFFVANDRMNELNLEFS